MEKRFKRYFGRNIGRKVYLVSCGLIIAGFIIGYLYWMFYGFPLIVLGVILFFISSATQISDKDIDTKVAGDVSNFPQKHIEGKVIDKTTLESKDFDVFYGFVRESGDVRFKIGRDRKVRTSNYYITALSVNKKECKVVCTLNNLLSEKQQEVRYFSTLGADKVVFEKEAIEFPKGNFKCKIKVLRGESLEEFCFYLPDDSLAERLTENINK